MLFNGTTPPILNCKIFCTEVYTKIEVNWMYIIRDSKLLKKYYFFNEWAIINSGNYNHHFISNTGKKIMDGVHIHKKYQYVSHNQCVKSLIIHKK